MLIYEGASQLTHSLSSLTDFQNIHVLQDSALIQPLAIHLFHKIVYWTPTAC